MSPIFCSSSISCVYLYYDINQKSKMNQKSLKYKHFFTFMFSILYFSLKIQEYFSRNILLSRIFNKLNNLCYIYNQRVSFFFSKIKNSHGRNIPWKNQDWNAFVASHKKLLFICYHSINKIFDNYYIKKKMK